MTTVLPRLAFVTALGFAASACGLGLRNPDIADLRNNPGRYHDRSVNVDGIVTSAWGVSGLFKMYKVDDGTGEVTVVSRRGGRTVTRGDHVRVKGRINELAVLGDEAVGLHLSEERVDIRRQN